MQTLVKWRYYIAGFVCMAIISCIPLCAKAELLLSIGAGKSIIETKQEHAFERVILAGYQVGDDLFIRPQVGYYMTNGYGDPSGWGSLVFGVKAKSTTGPVLSIGVGPSYLVSPDEQILSGHFQFNLEGCVGIQSKYYLGMCYTHLSNAGISQPNRGRDFLMVQLRM